MQILLPGELKIEQFSFKLACLKLVLFVSQELLKRVCPRSFTDFILQILNALDHVLEPVVVVLQCHILNLALLNLIKIGKSAGLRSCFTERPNSLLLVVYSANPADIVVIDRAPSWAYTRLSIYGGFSDYIWSFGLIIVFFNTLPFWAIVLLEIRIIGVDWFCFLLFFGNKAKATGWHSWLVNILSCSTLSVAAHQELAVEAVFILLFVWVFKSHKCILLFNIGLWDIFLPFLVDIHDSVCGLPVEQDLLHFEILQIL